MHFGTDQYQNEHVIYKSEMLIEKKKEIWTLNLLLLSFSLQYGTDKPDTRFEMKVRKCRFEPLHLSYASVFYDMSFLQRSQI